MKISVLLLFILFIQDNYEYATKQQIKRDHFEKKIILISP